MAETIAAPAAEKDLSPKPKLTSFFTVLEGCDCGGSSLPSLNIFSETEGTFPSKSTLVAATALIHEGTGTPCLDPTIPLFNTRSKESKTEFHWLGY